MSKKYNIIIDAMGSDHAPEVEVLGALEAIKMYEDIEITLVGDKNQIDTFLGENTAIKVIHADDVIDMNDDPVRAIRRKPNSSLAIALTEVKEGRADAIVSAGSTGALLAGGLFVVGRIEGIERPALAPLLPTLDGSGVILTDAGASNDARPSFLVQYAIMGSVYSQIMTGKARPKVGLLNNGAEEKKGTDLHKDSYKLLQEDQNINFLGNVEARDILTGKADVIVTDGFSGNIALKSIEGTALTVFEILKRELSSSFKAKLGAGLLYKNFKNVKKTLDYAEAGGALFIGCKAPIIKAHGSSNATAIKNAIRQARTIVAEDMVEKIKAKIETN